MAAEIPEKTPTTPNNGPRRLRERIGKCKAGGNRTAVAGNKPVPRRKSATGKEYLDKMSVKAMAMMATDPARFVGISLRSSEGRRFRDLVCLHLSDLGGVDVSSEAQRSLARRAAVTTIVVERFERRILANEPTDLDMYGRLVGQLRRLLECLGIERRPRLVSSVDARKYLEAAAIHTDAKGTVIAPPLEIEQPVIDVPAEVHADA
jgi:hypothetical protein